MVIGDWGTTNLRVYLVDRQGRILRQAASGYGLAKARVLGFGKALEQMLERLEAPPELPVYLSGMIGSKHGWTEAPYARTPADARGMAKHYVRIESDRQIIVVGGLCHEQSDGRKDVIRGEEVQVLGIVDAYQEAELICLPGTHSKWVNTNRGSIQSFTTWMTGDVFRALSRHTIFREQISDQDFYEDAFDLGLRHAAGKAWLHDLFLLRTDYLFGRISALEFHSYLSGVMIGSEIDAVPLANEVYLCGSDKLMPLYQRALGQRQLKTVTVDVAEATIRGVLTISNWI